MKSTREIAEEYRLSHWAQIMRERLQSGLTIKAFCRQIGICGNTYYYWQRRVRAAACEQFEVNRPENTGANLPAPRFTEVRVTEPVASPSLPGKRQIRIEIGNIQMTADSTYPPDKLAGLLRELTRTC